MKSFQVRNVYGTDSPELQNYSDLQVCSSAAGYFLGTVHNAQEGYAEPGSRDTDYYKNKSDAEYSLSTLERCVALKIPEEDQIAVWEGVMAVMQLDPRAVGYRMNP